MSSRTGCRLLQKIKQTQLRNLSYGSEGGVSRGLGVDEPTGGGFDVRGDERVFLLAELYLGIAEIRALRLRLIQGVAIEDALAGNVVEGITQRGEGGVESSIR